MRVTRVIIEIAVVFATAVPRTTPLTTGKKDDTYLKHNHSKRSLGWAVIHAMICGPTKESSDDQDAANENQRWIGDYKTLSEKCK